MKLLKLIEPDTDLRAKVLPTRLPYGPDDSKNRRYKSRLSFTRIIGFITVCLLFLFISQRPSTAGQREYTLEPLPLFGARVVGLDLNKSIHPETINALKQDTITHHLLLFQHQDLTESEYTAFIQQIGDYHFGLYHSADTDHPGVGKLINSNDGDLNTRNFEGVRNFHSDGVHLSPRVPLFVVQYLKLASRVCSTRFLLLNEFLRDCASRELIKLWDRAYMRRRQGNSYDPWYPILVHHPVTGKSTLLAHVNNPAARIGDQLALDKGQLGKEKIYPGYRKEYKHLVSDMFDSFEQCSQHVYEHHWESGDLALLDNISLLHAAGLGSNTTIEQNGIREMWRTSIQSKLEVIKSQPYA